MTGQRDIEQRILGSTIDDTTKVRLFQILDAGPSETELFLIGVILTQKERYKIPDLDVDAKIRHEFNQP